MPWHSKQQRGFFRYEQNSSWCKLQVGCLASTAKQRVDSALNRSRTFQRTSHRSGRNSFSIPFGTTGHPRGVKDNRRNDETRRLCSKDHTSNLKHQCTNDGPSNKLRSCPAPATFSTTSIISPSTAPSMDVLSHWKVQLAYSKNKERIVCNH